MRKLILAACAALSLTSCAPMAGLALDGLQSASSQAVGDKVVLEGTRALVLAELAYNQVATLALVATQNGLIKGETATRLRALNKLATDALVAGKAAQSNAERARAAASVFSSVDQIRALIT